MPPILTRVTTATAEIAALQNQTRGVLRDRLQPGEQVALLDYPTHQNAGDSLIYLGERGYLRDLDVTVSYIADQARFDADELRRRCPSGPILLHGGGNLGDRWEGEQEFREHILAVFPDRPIVQLPQSIEFHDPARIVQARGSFEAHPDLSLLLRDQTALRLAREYFPATRSEFCPDMAFGVGDTYQVHFPNTSHDVVALMRGDSERVVDDFPLPPLVRYRRDDWGLKGWHAAAWAATRTPARVVSRVPASRHALYPAVHRGYDASARLNVDSAQRILRRGRVVLTDRLHAAILAALMGIPVIALDNVSKKISAVFIDYLGRLPGTHFAETPAEANDILDEFFNR